MTATQDSYNFELVGQAGKEFGGYVSTNDETNVAPNILVQGSLNVYKNLSQRIQNRCGLKRRGAGDDSENGVASTYEWYDSLGRTFPTRVLESGVLQVESDIAAAGTFVWYDLYTDADHTRYCFSPWWDNDQQKDLLLMVKGDSDILAWSGGIAIGGTNSISNAVASVNQTVFTNAGSGYAIGDLVSLNNATGAVVEITAESGGIPSIVRLNNGGYAATGGGDSATTAITGAGAGLIVNITALTPTNLLTTSDSLPWIEKGFLTGTDDGLLVNSIVISGTEYTYGGIDGDIMFGLSSAVGAGAVIFQAVVITTDKPGEDFKNDICIVNGNQFIVGSYTSRLVYGSLNTNYTDFTPVDTTQEADVIGDPFILTLDDTLKGFAIRQGNLQVAAGLGDWYEIVITSSQVPFTDQASLVQTITVNKKPAAALSAPLAQEFITNNGDDIYYLGQDHQVYIYGSFTQQFSNRFPVFSQEIRDELKAEDFTGGAMRFVADSVYLTSKVSGKTYIYQARQYVDESGNIKAERLWFAPYDWNISRVCIIDSVLYGASSENPQYYQLFDTGQFHDDTPTDDIAPYECRAAFAYWYDRDRSKLIDVNRVFIEGYIAPNSELSLITRLNYLGSTNEQADVISALDSNPTLFTSAGVIAIGEGHVGGDTIGGGVPDAFGTPGIPKFRFIVSLKKFQVFEYQVEFYSFALDAQWEILCVGGNQSKVLPKPVFLQKTN